MPRYRSPKRYLALDLMDDGTFTLWEFDESEPFVRTWNIYEGRVTSSTNRLVLSSTTKTRYVDGDTAPDTTVFVVNLDHGTPIEIEVFGATHALAPEPW